MSTEHTDGNESTEPRTEQSRLAGDGGIIIAGDDGEILDESDASDDGRPEDCACWDPEGALPCWACYRDGFDVPNPDAPGDD